MKFFKLFFEAAVALVADFVATTKQTQRYDCGWSSLDTRQDFLHQANVKYYESKNLFNLGRQKKHTKENWQI